MRNGTAAMKKGFVVTVRELPFTEVPVTYEDIKELYPDSNKVPKDFVKVKPGKNDPDSYISSKEDYTALTEKYFVVWLAEKRFFEADSLVKERQAVSEIADLLRYIDDPLVLDQCIDQLNKIHGRTKFWKDAVSQARGEAKRQKTLNPPLMNDSAKWRISEKLGYSLGTIAIILLGTKMKTRL